LRALVRGSRTTARGRRLLVVEARAWVLSDDRSWPFSYQNLCDALDIAGNELRRRLMNDSRSEP
jgi:hypothetical protein